MSERMRGITRWVALAEAVIVAGVLFRPSTAVSQESQAGAEEAIAPRVDLGFAVTEHRLANGLKILLSENHTVPTVTLWSFYRVGSRNERPGITGISHLFEHMMFNGARKYGPKQFDLLLESNGGYSNAYTSKDMTAYFETFPSTALRLVMDLESDRMRSLDISDETLASERGVVKEERRFRTDNSIPGKMGELLYATAYMAHPYQWPVVGWMADLDSITRTQCQDYFGTYYAPNNCTMVLVGDFDTREAMALFDEFFADIPSGPTPANVPDAEPEQTGERRVEHHYPAQAEAFYCGYHVPALDHADTYPLEVLSTVLSVGESSRLHRRLVYDEQVALAVSSGFRWRLHPGLYLVFVEMRPGRAAAVGERMLYEELARVADEGIGERELKKAKNLIKADFVRNLKTNEGRGDEIGTYEFWFGSANAMEEVLARLLAVSAQDVQRVAEIYFQKRNRTVVVLVPERAADGVTQ